MSDKWINASRRLPDKCGYYLTVSARFRKGKPVHQIIHVRWYDEGAHEDPDIKQHYDTSDWEHLYTPNGIWKRTRGMRVTHWMPLSEPPTQKDE